MQQLNLPFCLDEHFLTSYLGKATDKTISLVVTDNSTSMLSIKTRANSVSLRLHRIFLSAEEDVLDDIVGFIKSSKRKTPLITSFINQNSHLLKNKPPRKVNIRPQGKIYNLRDIYDSVNTDYFEGRVSSSITWGIKGRRRVAANRTLGSFSIDENIIRINPILDSRIVPRYFVSFIVYHEMLHADMGIKRNSGRQLVHSKEFKKREKLFRHYEKALAWEKKRW